MVRGSRGGPNESHKDLECAIQARGPVDEEHRTSSDRPAEALSRRPASAVAGSVMTLSETRTCGSLCARFRTPRACFVAEAVISSEPPVPRNQSPADAIADACGRTDPWQRGRRWWQSTRLISRPRRSRLAATASRTCSRRLTGMGGAIADSSARRCSDRAPLRVCRIERVRLHADLTILAKLSCALSRARAVQLAA
jgi:hypothetical protein